MAEEYTNVVLGDLDGNGVITTKDYTRIYSYFCDDYELEGVSLVAADMDQNDKITTKDYTTVYNYFLED